MFLGLWLEHSVLCLLLHKALYSVCISPYVSLRTLTIGFRDRPIIQDDLKILNYICKHLFF